MAGDFYKIEEFLESDLKSWVASSPKMKFNISNHNLKYLFEFTGKRALTIDLCRFNYDYYSKVFASSASQEVIDAFAKKACLVMRDTLIRIGKEEIDITITVKQKISIISYWQTLYVNQNFTAKSLKLRKKDNNW